MPDIYMSKARYLAGLQCAKRLWLISRDEVSPAAIGPGSPQEIGRFVGNLARGLFPGGVLVKTGDHAEAVASTGPLLADGKVQAVFEAAFAYGGLRIRTDILVRREHDEWALYEVKSGGSIKDHYFDDVAIQVHVLRELGIRLASTHVLHLNTDYVRREEGIQLSELFAATDVAREVEARLSHINDLLRKQTAYLREDSPPTVEPGDHCHKPTACEYWQTCTASKPHDWLFNMPNMRAEQRAELSAIGVDRISQIPAGFPLSERQRVVRDVTRDNSRFIDEKLASSLVRFGPPALYLDFEAFSPPVPVYDNTSPYEVIPFQWSMHRVGESGEIVHEEYLADGRYDPRREFAQSLIDACSGNRWPIVVYSAYEKTQLKALCRLFPDLAEDIGGIIDRLADLLPVVRAGVYLPEFEFGFSIKSVAPALCSDLTYGSLGSLSNGSAAAAAFWKLANREVDASEIAELRYSLLKYCELDTWAMVRVHQELLRL